MVPAASTQCLSRSVQANARAVATSPMGLCQTELKFMLKLNIKIQFFLVLVAFPQPHVPSNCRTENADARDVGGAAPGGRQPMALGQIHLCHIVEQPVC